MFDILFGVLLGFFTVIFSISIFLVSDKDDKDIILFPNATKEISNLDLIVSKIYKDLQ